MKLGKTSRAKRSLSGLQALELLEHRRLFNTYFVTNSNDAGTNSLRQAIINANANPGLDTIAFTSGFGGFSISPRSALDQITDPVIIDGTTQSGYAGTPLVRIDGTSAGNGYASGLYLTAAASGSTIQGLAITNWHNNGIRIDSATGNIITGNYLGLNTAGTALGNTYAGLLLVSSSNNSVTNNVISANGLVTLDAGIDVDGGSGNAFIANYIGTSINGSAARANGGPGISLYDGANQNRIGTDGDNVNDAAERNVISANLGGGIQLAGVGTSLNVIAGNYIGTDAIGSTALGNGGPGILIHNGSSNNQIGGPSAVFGNLIAFNGAPYPTLGGYHYNDAPGIALTDTAVNNSIRANIIYSNRGQGIDLSATPAGSFVNYDGVNVNHASNLAIGPNHLQNYPVLLGATAGATTAVSGRLISIPSTTLALDFYASSAPNASLFGDAQRYLGSASVSTDATGNVSFSTSLSATTAAGEYITATATDLSGNTSEFSAALKLNTVPLVISSTTWTPIGPAPISTSGDGVLAAGRVADAVPDPTNVNVMYVVADGGGIWKTSDWLDATPLWTPLTDAQSSLQQGAGYKTLAIAPSNPQILYDVVSGPGSGILKSVDGGSSWTLLASATFHQTFFSSIAVDPTDPNTLYAGVWQSSTAGGVYKSTDGGAHWINTTASVHGGDASDLMIDPNNTQTLYAGLVKASVSGNGSDTAGLYKSVDGGATWTRFTTGLVAPANVGAAIRIAVAPSNSQAIYTTFFDTTLGNAPDGMPHRFATTNGGTTWSALANLPTLSDSSDAQVVLAVDPTNAQIVYANADRALYRSITGGTSWTATPIFAEDPVNVRFDQSKTLVLAGDRGIYRWPGGLTPFANKQGNLQNTENFTIALDPSDEKKVYAVAQDQHHVLVYSGSGVWNAATSGNDVGKVLVSPTNPARLWDFAAGFADGADAGPATAVVMRSDDGGATWSNAATGLPTGIESAPQSYTFQKAFVLDPANPHRLLLGLNQLYETTDDGDSWHSLTGVTPPWNGKYVTSIAIAASNANTLYVATDDGRFWTTTNNGATWAERDAGLPIQGLNRVVDMKVNPADPLQVIAVTGADRSGVAGGHVWLTQDGGVTWTNISGSLNPENWAQSLAVDWRFANPMLYVGTARGVYATSLSGSSTAWSPFASGLPNVVVEDLQLQPSSNLLAAGTYGRGVFEIRVTAPLAIAITLGNTITIKRDADNVHADITANGTTTPIDLSQASGFSVTGSAGNDTLTLDFSNGNPLPAGGLTFAGGSGVNTLSVIGTSGDDTLTAGPAGLTFSGGGASNVPISATNLQSIRFRGGSGGSDLLNLAAGSYTLDADTPSGTPSVSVTVQSGASATFATPQHLASLAVSGGRVTFTPLTTPPANYLLNLSITGGGQVDLGNGSLRVDTTTATTAAAVIGYVHSGQNGGRNWNGPGLSSSLVAAADAVAWQYAVGFALPAEQALVRPIVPAGQILVQPTLIGDSNLDGTVDGADFSTMIAAGKYQGGVGGQTWASGDWNGDGFVDNNDVSLLIASGNYQAGTTFALGPPPAPSVVAPPPPATAARVEAPPPPTTDAPVTTPPTDEDAGDADPAPPSADDDAPMAMPVGTPVTTPITQVPPPAPMPPAVVEMDPVGPMTASAPAVVRPVFYAPLKSSVKSKISRHKLNPRAPHKHRGGFFAHRSIA